LISKSSNYQHIKGRSLGENAIKLIGRGVENATKYWLIVNIWNKLCGDNGSLKILRGINHFGIEYEIVAGRPKLNLVYLKFLQ